MMLAMTIARGIPKSSSILVYRVSIVIESLSFHYVPVKIDEAGELDFFETIVYWDTASLRLNMVPCYFQSGSYATVCLSGKDVLNDMILSTTS